MINSATAASGTAGRAFTYQITATNSPTSFGASGLPAGITINTTSGLISGTPSASGTSAVTLTATNSGGTGNATLTLTINSEPSGTLSVSPTTLAFGNQPAATTTSAQVVTLNNSGSSAITISSTSLTGANASDFNQTTTCGSSLAAGASCTIAIQFTPSIVGAETASLSISSNSSNSPQAVTLTGSGTHDVVLTWGSSSTSGIAGYNIYRGTTSGGESATPLNSSPVSVLTYADSNVQAGQQYFYYVTAVTSANGQSTPSNEVSATVPSN